MTATLKATGRAAEIGRRDRESYEGEFGESPVVGEVGDRDAIGVTEMWVAVSRESDVDVASPEGMGLYQEARIAYLKALFDTEDVA